MNNQTDLSIAAERQSCSTCIAHSFSFLGGDGETFGKVEAVASNPEGRVPIRFILDSHHTSRTRRRTSEDDFKKVFAADHHEWDTLATKPWFY